MKMGRLGLAFVGSVLLITKGVSANEEITVGLPSGVEMEMVWVDPGFFWMGLPVSEGGNNVELTRLHEVTISKGFYLGKYEVTQEQWEWEYACRAGSDSHWWFGDDESRLRHYGWYDQSIRDLGLHTAQQ